MPGAVLGTGDTAGGVTDGSLASESDSKDRI